MEPILAAELKRQMGKIQALIDEGSTFSGPTQYDQVLKVKIALKLHLENTTKTLDKYMLNIPSSSEELAASCFECMSNGQEMLITAETLLQSHQVEKAEPSSPSFPITKLPHLTLPKFGGDILEFNQFWDRFESSVGSRNLNDVDKLAYLLGCLEGAALEAIQGITTTNANYSVAVETLQERFGDKTLIVDAHYKALATITKGGNDVHSCRKNLDQIKKHLRILGSLGEDVENNHVRSLILDKFPERILYEINLLCRKEKTVTTIRKELGNIITAMELANPHRDSVINEPSTSTEVLHIKSIRPKRKNVKMQDLKPPSGLENRKRKSSEPMLARYKINRKCCIFCSGAHFNDECTVAKDLRERKRKLGNRCYICFGTGHRSQYCKHTPKCAHCSGPHNRALCWKKITSKYHGEKKSVILENHISKCPSVLQTATALVLNNQSNKKCRILLDCGSQRSYLTYKLCRQLKMKIEKEDLLMIYTFGEEKPKEMLSPVVDIYLRTNRNIERKLTVNVVNHITDRLPLLQLKNSFSKDVLADDGSAGKSIDILIGNDYYHSFMRQEKIRIEDNLYLVDTDFGWIVSGCLNTETQDKYNILSFATYYQSSSECACYTEPDLPLKNTDIKFLWSLENIGITDSPKTTREEEAVQHFNETVKYEQGRYHVRWPWTVYPPNLSTNYGLAYGRLKGLLQRLDMNTLQEYDNILKEQLKSNIIEIVDVNNDPTYQVEPPIHYLPHHLVKHPEKRGRIVYDASAKIKGQQSLNECMFRGPCMLQDLTALLLNFRMNKVAIVADVEKAFLQVGLQDNDREVTRFLWVKDIKKPLSKNNMIHLHFCRVPFGIISSPFLLTAVIRHHIATTNNSLLEKVANKCYVDNLVTGANTTQEALNLLNASRKSFNELSMNIRDWTSNDKIFMAQIPESIRSKCTEQEKVLGLLWNKRDDRLELNIKDKIFIQSETKVCKREVR